MSIRAIIADDEPLARRRVRALLAAERDVEIVAEGVDGEATVAAIEAYRPDLLFLDVQMPRLDGFEVLGALDPEIMPLVIFTTAYDEHALRAFEVHAMDYLVKPFNEARFHDALTRVRAHLQAHRRQEPDPRMASLLAHVRAAQRGGPRLLVKETDRIFFLRADQVDHLETAGNYVVVHCGEERHIVRETMAAMERRLAEAGFMRISRSLLVNLHRIRELQPMGASEYCVILRSGARLAMTCSLREVQQRMSEL